MISNCLKYFRINTISVILNYLWVVHLPNLFGGKWTTCKIKAEVSFKDESKKN